MKRHHAQLAKMVDSSYASLRQGRTDSVVSPQQSSSEQSTIPSPPGMNSQEPVEDPMMHTEGFKDREELGMSRTQFRRYGKETVDYIADYMENVHKRRVVPAIEPGYLSDLLPKEAPQTAEHWESVIDDFEKFIMPGVTHWQHPRFHAYFPAGNSFPSILADMLSDALGCVGFSWAACPAMTELEVIMLDWFGKMIGLPADFLPSTEGGRGGGVIQSSASECNFVSLLAARFEVMKELRQRFPFVEEGLLLSKLIAYCSKEAHSSVEKACMIGMVKLRILETDSKFRLRGDTLRNAIQEDRNLGLIPFYVSTTLGTTSCCSFDVLSEIGPVCQENELWLHVDAAYAGSAMICPEFRHLMNGVEYAMSFNTNPNKFMLLNFDCSTMWVRDRFKLTQALVVDPLYLQHSWMDKSIDYRHWGIPLSRRFRSLKLWFVIRMYGVEGLQKYIRLHVRLAKMMEELLSKDPLFEIVGDVLMGLVCFRMKGDDKRNQALLTRLNSSGRIHMVPASLNDRFVIRFCVCAENANEKDIEMAYEIIKNGAQHVLHDAAAETLVEDEEAEQAEEQAYLECNEVLRKTSLEHLPHLEKQLSKEELLAQKQHETLAKKSFAHLHDVFDGMLPVGLAKPSFTEDFTNTSTSSIESLNSLGNETKQINPTPDESALSPTPGSSTDGEESFLVRMVSDPKCYNPKIVRHLNMANHRKMSQDVFRDRTLMKTISTSQRPTRLSRNSPGSGNSMSNSVFMYDDEDERYVAPSQTGVQTPI